MASAKAGLAILPQLVARARAEWPQLGLVGNTELEEFILARIPGERLDPDVRSDDMLLACACAKGMLAAHDAIYELTEVDIERVHARIKPPISVQRARQLVYRKLFTVPEGGVARIALYKGDIEIEGYVRNVASRELLALASRTKQRPDSIEDNILEASDGAVSPLRAPVDQELDRVKRNYLPGLRLAITHAAASLEALERALLRYTLVEQLGFEGLALMYQVAPATMVEWIRSARERFEFRIKHSLTERLRVSDRDHTTLVRFVGGQLDLLLVGIVPRDEMKTISDE